MLQNAYLLVQIGADTAEKRAKFRRKLLKIGNCVPRRGASRRRAPPRHRRAAQRDRAPQRGGRSLFLRLVRNTKQFLDKATSDELAFSEMNFLRGLRLKNYISGSLRNNHWDIQGNK